MSLLFAGDKQEIDLVLLKDSIFNMCFIYRKSEFPVYHFLKSELRFLLTMILSVFHHVDKQSSSEPNGQICYSTMRDNILSVCPENNDGFNCLCNSSNDASSYTSVYQTYDSAILYSV